MPRLGILAPTVAAALIAAAVYHPTPPRLVADQAITGHVVTVSAHRGGAGQWPQDSMQAFQSSLAAGYDEIEADAWIAVDGQPVIYHDNTISADRCGGPYAGQLIYTLTAQQVATITCDGQPIPTEQQLVALVAADDGDTELRLEVKSYGGQLDSQARSWAMQVAAMVVNAGITDRTIMQDFDWTGIDAMHEVDPDLRVSALIGHPTEADVDRAARLGAYDVSYDATYSTPSLNTYISQAGLVPTVWRVDAVPAQPGTPDEATASAAKDAFTLAARQGARVVITNYPDLLTSQRDAGPTVLVSANRCRVSSSTSRNRWMVSNVAGGRSVRFHAGVTYKGRTKWFGWPHSVDYGQAVVITSPYGGRLTIQYNADGTTYRAGQSDATGQQPTAYSDHTVLC